MTKKLLIIIAALLFCGTVQAQSYHWSYNFHDYENNFPLIGEVYLDGVALASSDYEIAAFVGNQVRATEFLFEADPATYPGRYYAWLGVAYNNTNETVTFKLYDHATNTEYDICSTTVLTEANGYGETWDPILIEFTSPVVYGPDYPWTVVGGFENYMYIEAQVQINGVPVTNTAWEVGAFCGDVCRGLGDADNWWVSPVDGSNILEIVVGGAANDVINFYLYDATNSEIFHGFCFTTLDWIDGDIGDMFNPYIINFVTEQTFTKDIVGYTGTSDRYYLIASPIGDVNPTQVTNMLSNNFDLYYFDQSEDLEWRNYEASPFNLVSGKGYLYANSANVTLSFKGFPYGGDGKVTLTKTDNVNNSGWNLIGNPFATIATPNKPYYKLNSDGNALSASTENSSIAMMEGVFVQAETDGEIVTFNPTTRNEQPATIAKTNILVSDVHNTVIDNAIIRFDGGATLEKYHLFEGSNIYFQQENKYYAIVNADNESEMPVNFKAAEKGTYTLTFRLENIDLDYLHLIDNMTGMDIDLLKQPSYSFDARPSDYASRFRLVFNASNDDDDHFAFISNSDIIINGVSGNTTVQLFDVTGRLLSSTNGANRISTKNMSNGVYMLRLINGESTKTQKVIIR